MVAKKKVIFLIKMNQFNTCLLHEIVWRILFMAFNISLPNNIINPIGNWLKGVDKKDKVQIRVGVYALLWAI